MTAAGGTWSTPVSPEEKRLIPCDLCGGTAFRPFLRCKGFSYVQCRDCGLVQMNPQPLPEAIRRRYGEGHGKDYLAYELANEEPFFNLQVLALKDAEFDRLLSGRLLGTRLKDAGNTGRVLDIGCATGRLLAHLREQGWETTGVEISGPQADYARKKRGLDIRSLPLEENRFPASFFDAVLASHVIEHLNSPASLVKEARRILVPGGMFIVTTPNIAGFQARLFGKRWRSAIFDHLYLFSVKTLSRLLRQEGFSLEKTITWGGLAAGTAPLPLKRLFDRGAKRFGFGDVVMIRARKP